MISTNVKCLDMACGADWVLYHGDNVEVNKAIPDNSIHYRVFSPPFASLYTYSNSPRDMGNCSDNETFNTQYRYLIAEQYRTHKPGRLLSFHCMNLPTSKTRDGYIGVRDFRGELIRMYEDAGWIYHSEVVIWKNPVTAMQRTKALGLLHKQVCKDSAMSRQGIPDYLVTMRKPGDNDEPVAGRLEDYYGTQKLPSHGDRSINVWQNYASPVWFDIDPSDTLQYQSARDNNDERHVCPLQLQVIRRGIQLWSNPGDVVMDDFNGIGSTGHVALEMNRKYIGIELKDSYYKAAKTNITNTAQHAQGQLAFA
jgi:DNA modification methylase